MQYGFQAWNAHILGRWRDLLFGIGSKPNPVEKVTATVQDIAGR